MEAILGRALEREHRGGELTHEDLVATAREVGIASEAIETAAAEVLAERTEQLELRQLRREQWRRFVAHLIPYIIINGFLVTLNFLTTHFPWALFPAFGWGIGLAFHFTGVLLPNRQRQLRRLERRRDRERRRALRHQLRTDARRLQQDVGQGISAVLNAAAERIAHELAPPDRGHKKAADPPRTRVADDEAAPTGEKERGTPSAPTRSQQRVP